jgi:N-acetylglucosamine-6-phosphate deacetylase
VSLNPARLLGLDDRLGSIEVGKAADLVAFEARRDFSRIARVWVDGRERLRLDVAVGSGAPVASTELRAAVG